MKSTSQLKHIQSKLYYHLQRVSRLQTLITHEEKAIFYCLQQENKIRNTYFMNENAKSIG